EAEGFAEPFVEGTQRAEHFVREAILEDFAERRGGIHETFGGRRRAALEVIDRDHDGAAPVMTVLVDEKVVEDAEEEGAGFSGVADLVAIREDTGEGLLDEILGLVFVAR